MQNGYTCTSGTLEPYLQDGAGCTFSLCGWAVLAVTASQSSCRGYLLGLQQRCFRACLQGIQSTE